jgi:predicted 3-demethylubiquinone-9 3-methyltransferase (glyoxalase superfamily)
MQKIIPHLWFDTQAEEAVAFYSSVFNGGKVHSTTHYTEAGFEIHGMKAGTVLTIEFELEGFRFVGLNGGPHFKFTPAISFMVNFDPSREPDAEGRLNNVWEKLSEGGKVLMPIDTYPFSKRYGWVQDKYGVSWQLILSDPEGEERPVIVPAMLFVGDVVGKAAEAIDLYTSVFKNSKKGISAPYGEGQEPDKPGTLMFADFMLEGQWFAAMDSARVHDFTFNEAISLMVTCEDQEEIDYFWQKLSFVPEAEQCGWLKDKFGVSWQIIPKGMVEMLNAQDKERSNKAMEAMLQMKKIDINALQEAFNS